jgi:hypothetical protein
LPETAAPGLVLVLVVVLVLGSSAGYDYDYEDDDEDDWKDAPFKPPRGESLSATLGWE